MRTLSHTSSGWSASVLRGLLAVALTASIALSVELGTGVPTAFADTSTDLGEQNVVDPTQRADNSFIYDTTIASLFEDASLYNDRTVQVVGEVIGDRISADEGHCWVMITELDVDNPSSVSVLLSNELADQIDSYGRYGVTGTTLQVRGVYHQACSVHDGLPDVHATAAAVVAKGVAHPDKTKLEDFVPGIVTVGIGLLLMAGFYFARERMR